MTTQELNWNELINKALTVKGSMGNTYNRFYDYSFGNQILLYWQGVTEPVATYKKWAELGRQVKKGSKAKAIIQPIVGKDESDNTEIKGFFLKNSLFSLSETIGDAVPLPEIPKWNRELALERLNIKLIPFKKNNGNVQGYANKQGIAINPVAVNPTKTLFHEIAHRVLGHTDNSDLHKGVKEFQAECSAYLLMIELELATWEQLSVSRAYIQEWLQDTKPTEQEIKQVFNAVDKIIKAGKE